MTPERSRLQVLQGLTQQQDLEGAFVALAERRRAAFSLWPAGLPLGALTHLDGPAATETALRCVAEQQSLAAPQGRAAWVEARISAYPPGLVQRGLDLACLLFVEGEAQYPWAVTELLRSQAFRVVVVASALPDAKSLRRLQLAAEGAGVLALLLAPLPEEAWAVRTRLRCEWLDGAPALRDATAAEAPPRAEAG